MNLSKILAVTSIASLILLLCGCTQFIFQPLRPHLTTPEIFDAEFEDVYVETIDGLNLHGWKIPTRESRKGAVLYFHGNAENISTHFINVIWLTDYGYDVFVFDYRGYGKSQGIAQLDRVVTDMDAIIGQTLEHLDSTEKLNVLGHSLGGSLAIRAVAQSQFRESIGLLVTVEAFSDYRLAAKDMLASHWLTWLFQWPLSFTINNRYRPLEVVGEITPIPLVIMHSRQDEIIPYYHAEALYAAAKEPRALQTIDSDHNQIFNRQENKDLLLKYLDAEGLQARP